MLFSACNNPAVIHKQLLVQQYKLFSLNFDVHSSFAYMVWNLKPNGSIHVNHFSHTLKGNVFLTQLTNSSKIFLLGLILKRVQVLFGTFYQLSDRKHAGEECVTRKSQLVSMDILTAAGSMKLAELPGTLQVMLQTCAHLMSTSIPLACMVIQ